MALSASTLLWFITLRTLMVLCQNHNPACGINSNNCDAITSEHTNTEHQNHYEWGDGDWDPEKWVDPKHEYIAPGEIFADKDAFELIAWRIEITPELLFARQQAGITDPPLWFLERCIDNPLLFYCNGAIMSWLPSWNFRK